MVPMTINWLYLCRPCYISLTIPYLHTGFHFFLAAHLNYLMEENDDCMILPDEYIAMYEKPFDVTLESGRYIH